MLTSGEGGETATPPPSLWRVLVVLACIHHGHHDRERARQAAARACRAAQRAKSVVGIDRTRAVLGRVA